MPIKISIEGFKAIGDRVDVELRPLTLLAGANSSGKSSLMQGILLLKQTFEAPYDPGPILLNGPHVRFTSIDQLLHTGVAKTSRVSGFAIGIDDGKVAFETQIERQGTKEELAVTRFTVRSKGADPIVLTPNMDLTELSKIAWNILGMTPSPEVRFELVRDGFSLGPALSPKQGGGIPQRIILPMIQFDFEFLRKIIHIPGLRGNPARSYPLTATGPLYPGTFENYSASVIARWSETPSESEKLKELGLSLQRLGLTWKVQAKRVDGASVELRVGRMPRSVQGGARDLVNIADVGFGVSQTLPILVALIEAKPGQLVYIEQPEIHLHPRAQVAMAELLADAAKRGVILVIETHSSSLLLAVQTLVAEGQLPPDRVKLHWFTRDEKSGATKITSADLDQGGRFGDWPEDFDDVSLEAESRYLDAAEAFMARE